jgi:hypothetical protein
LGYPTIATFMVGLSMPRVWTIVGCCTPAPGR